MQPDEKRELVRRLVEIISRDKTSEQSSPSDIGYEFSKRMNEKIQQEQIELHMKHFDAEQIKALLDFYDSPMGRSILECQSNIDHELADNISVVSEDVHQQTVEEIQSKILQKDNNT
ncbi:MAG: hypothetical protein DHS20C12_06430 [Pseudohongiella sp.]|nr:MAG: hypothetical protein DHS20C12_06430 [Pseudohongiella sp.]